MPTEKAVYRLDFVLAIIYKLPRMYLWLWCGNPCPGRGAGAARAVPVDMVPKAGGMDTLSSTEEPRAIFIIRCIFLNKCIHVKTYYLHGADAKDMQRLQEGFTVSCQQEQCAAGIHGFIPRFSSLRCS